MTTDVIKTLADKVQVRMQARAEAVAQQLKPVFHSGDAQNIPRSQWYDMIRQNWTDPEWRQKQAIQRDPVQFVKDSLEAHGLNPTLLNQNKDVINLGLSQWAVDANPEYTKFMEQFGGHQPAMPIVPIPNIPPQQPLPQIGNQPPMPPEQQGLDQPIQTQQPLLPPPNLPQQQPLPMG